MAHPVATSPEQLGGVVDSPVHDPEAVSADIRELVDGTFERLQPQLARYIADPRRRRGEDGTTLTADNHNVLWENGRYGRLALHACRQASAKEVAHFLQEDRDIARAVRDPIGSHYAFFENANELTDLRGDPPRFQHVASFVLLHILRDRYPRGHTEARESLMRPTEDYSLWPPEDWGERHQAGIEIITGWHDALTASKTRWNLKIMLQTRFDKPTPQLKIDSKLSGVVHTSDLGNMEVRKKHERALCGGDEVAMMRHVFGMAKDVRPVVTPIAQQLSSQAARLAMIREYLPGLVSGDTTSGS